MAAGAGLNALHAVLQQSNLLEYEPLLLEEGADDLNQLKELDEDEFQQLCLMVGMATKPFHVKRLQKSLGRPSTHLYVHKRGTQQSQEQQNPSLPIPSSTPSGGERSHLNSTPQLAPSPSYSSASTSVHFSHSSSQSLSSSPALHPPPVPPTSRSIPPSSSSFSSSLSSHYHSPSLLHTKQFTSAVKPSNSEHNNTGLGGVVSTSHGQPSGSKQFFLPICLQPELGLKDIGPLIDDTTPVQADLGVCPFGPSDWDIKRAELVKKHSAIYGHGPKRKNEELSVHEENVNEAAFQLCLRDPTLMVRRDELLVLSRRAIKEGGYTFQHGASKAKSSETASSFSDPKHTLEKASYNDTFGGEFGARRGVTPHRKLSRQKKLRRVQELEFSITKNKMKQSLKLTALEKARQGNDFSTVYHLQAEIESLGNTLASLQEEYSNMRYRLRRSDRYYERKRERGNEDPQGSPESAKRFHIQEPTSDIEQLEPSESPPTSSRHSPPPLLIPTSTQLFTHVLQQEVPPNNGLTDRPQSSTDSILPQQTLYTPLNDSPPPSPPSPSDSNKIILSSYSSSITSSPPPPPHLSTLTSSPTYSTPTVMVAVSRPSHSHSHTHQRDIPDDLAPIFPQLHTHPHTLTSSTASAYLGRTSATVTAQILPHRSTPSHLHPSQQHTPTPPHHEELSPRQPVSNHGNTLSNHGDEEVTSDQLLANINKLATQAAANLRSLPHF